MEEHWNELKLEEEAERNVGLLEKLKRKGVYEKLLYQFAMEVIRPYKPEIEIGDDNPVILDAIDDLMAKMISRLPAKQSSAGSQNSYVDSAVEGFNDAIDQVERLFR